MLNYIYDVNKYYKSCYRRDVIIVISDLYNNVISKFEKCVKLLNSGIIVIVEMK